MILEAEGSLNGHLNIGDTLPIALAKNAICTAHLGMFTRLFAPLLERLEVTEVSMEAISSQVMEYARFPLQLLHSCLPAALLTPAVCALSEDGVDIGVSQSR